MSRRGPQRAGHQPARELAADPLTVGSALELGRVRLSARFGEEAPREALFLLSGVLGESPGATALHRGRSLSDQQLAAFEARLTRRSRGEPLQYIEGRAAFRELQLRVDRSVLIPRPETEELVDRVLSWARGRMSLSAVDLGTGSGAIAISLALEGPFAGVVGVDISESALNVARENARAAGVGDQVEFRLGSLYEPLRSDERFDIVVSNPPYVAEAEADSLPAEVRDWEPPVALFAGPTGGEVLGRIVRGVRAHLREGGLLALEVAPSLADETVALIREVGAFRDPRILRDLAGQRRIVLAELE